MSNAPIPMTHALDAQIGNKGEIVRQDNGISLPPTYLYWDGTDWQPADFALGTIAYYPGINNLLSQSAEAGFIFNGQWRPPDVRRAYTFRASGFIAIGTAGAVVDISLLGRQSMSLPTLGTTYRLDFQRVAPAGVGSGLAQRFTLETYFPPGYFGEQGLPWSFLYSAKVSTGSGTWSSIAASTIPAWLKIIDEGIPPSGFAI